jgi:hypothetical protein
MARHAGTWRVTQPATVGGNRMTWTAISGHIMRSRETKGDVLTRKPTTRRHWRNLTALWSPVETTTKKGFLH